MLCWMEPLGLNESFLMDSTSHIIYYLNDPQTAGNAWLCTQHCGYWCSGAQAPGHQYPQCWLYIHCVDPVSFKDITITAISHLECSKISRLIHRMMWCDIRRLSYLISICVKSWNSYCNLSCRAKTNHYRDVLTHWGLNKMATILQMWFSK